MNEEMNEKKTENTDASEVKTIKIDDIIIPEFYPRKNINADHVQQLQANIENLDLIEVNQDNILKGGLHRTQAHRNEGLEEIKCIIVKTKDEDDLFDKMMEKKDAYASLPYTQKERKEYGIQAFVRGAETKYIAKKIGVAVDTVNKWVQPYRDDRTKQLEDKIIKLLLEGNLSQTEISEEIGVVNSKITEVKNKFSKLINLVIAKSDEVTEEQKEEYNDLSTFQPLFSDIWDVYKSHELTMEMIRDDKEIIQNLLLHYTELFDFVYTNDKELLNVCKSWFRRVMKDISMEVKPKLYVLGDNVADLDSPTEKIKDDGYLVIIAKTLEEDIRINAVMSDKKFQLKNRIIIPIHKETENKELTHSYESILVFSRK